MADYEPTNIEKVFELLDNKLVTLGIPGALSFVGIDILRKDLAAWQEAVGCFVAAAAVWIVIKRYRSHQSAFMVVPSRMVGSAHPTALSAPKSKIANPKSKITWSCIKLMLRA